MTNSKTSTGLLYRYGASVKSVSAVSEVVKLWEMKPHGSTNQWTDNGEPHALPAGNLGVLQRYSLASKLKMNIIASAAAT